jgi:hypothetical protein
MTTRGRGLVEAWMVGGEDDGQFVVINSLFDLKFTRGKSAPLGFSSTEPGGAVFAPVQGAWA